GAVHVRVREGDIETPAGSPGAEREPSGRVTQQCIGVIGYAAERAAVSRYHARVGVDPRPAGEAVALHGAGPIRPLAHRLARLSPALIGERAVLHRGYLEVDVDAVEQRAGHAREVAFHAERPAHAVVLRVSEIAAGTG